MPPRSFIVTARCQIIIKVRPVAHKIQEAERHLDTTISAPYSADGATSPATPAPAAAAVPAPVTVPEDHWLHLGANPKPPVSSDPSHHHIWSPGLWLALLSQDVHK